ncbi:D-alanine--D-alanine ligase family protein [Atribacter laminatus]|jgi:D-alanine-D-alanine ligase|uniref:D-alanine--D-alanine ligase n=1 Tax=Atribacter laminatus TaxID=2847778 RepID=A0A7T1AJW6_ATRLM|nr:hypothetical protein [Atribacter laminatus]QPM67249.1 D-alanine--D-alanine ligase [Atribacter laminatus]
MIINKILVAFSKKIFEEREKNFYSNRPDLQGKTVSMVIEALEQKGWDCHQLNVDVPLIELVPSLSNQNANFVFNLAVCSAEAYDQAFLPSLLDALNIPYLGSNSTIHSLCLDRALTKLSMRGIGIPTTSSIQWSPGDSLPDGLDYPYIIKSRFRNHCQKVSSDSIVNDQESLLKKAEEIFTQTNEKVLIEKFVEGREMVIGLWGNGNNPEVLPIMELNLSREKPLFDAEIESKKGYVDDISCPVKLSDEHKTMLESMAIKIFRELNLKDFATFHLIFDQKENLPLFFEINALPLLHYKHSAFPEMCSYHGIEYPVMIKKLLQIALERKKNERH